MYFTLLQNNLHIFIYIYKLNLFFCNSTNVILPSASDHILQVKHISTSAPELVIPTSSSLTAARDRPL